MRPPESARFSRSASSSISPPIPARNSESRSNQYALSWPGLNFCQRACPRHNNNSIATSWPSRPPIEIEILSSRPPAVHLEATFGLPRSTNSEIRLMPIWRAIGDGKARTAGRIKSRISDPEVSSAATSSHPCARRRLRPPIFVTDDACLPPFGRQSLFDKRNRLLGVVLAFESGYGRIFSADNMGDKESKVDARTGHRLCDGVTQSGLVVAFHQQRRNRGSAQACHLCGGHQFLARDGVDFNRRLALRACMAIAHDYLQIRTRLGRRFDSVRKRSRLVIDLSSPQDDLLHCSWHALRAAYAAGSSTTIRSELYTLVTQGSSPPLNDVPGSVDPVRYRAATIRERFLRRAARARRYADREHLRRERLGAAARGARGERNAQAGPLLKKLNATEEISYSSYRKFEAQSRTTV